MKLSAGRAKMKKSHIGLLVVVIILGSFFLGRAFGQREKETEMMATGGPVAEMVAAAHNQEAAERRSAAIKELKYLLWDKPERSDQELGYLLTSFIAKAHEQGEFVRVGPEGHILFITRENAQGEVQETIPLICWPMPTDAE
jgi:hypothetical protein